MGVTDLIFEPRPPNFENQYTFWRCLNIKMIFWFHNWFQIFKDQCSGECSVHICLLSLLYAVRGFWLKSIILKSYMLWASYPSQIAYVVYELPPLKSRCFWRLTLDLTLASYWKSKKKVALKSLNISVGELFSCCFDFFNLFSLEKSFRENSSVIANFKPLLTHTV